LETQISPKSQGLETGWLVVFEVFKVRGEKFQCCGINFSMRFQIKWSRNCFFGEVPRPLTLCWSRPNIEKIRNKNNVSDVSCDLISRKNKRNESKNYFPQFPSTRSSSTLIPDHFYVRFFDFPVFLLFLLLVMLFIITFRI